MRMLVAAALMLNVTAVPALSQAGYGRNEQLDKLHEQQQQRQKQDEKEYNDTMRRLKTDGGAKVQNDPWRTVRPIENTRR
ncbi:MAG: hypothetical protein FJX62_14040 [Alphaproteobacteria bacterium]|nr:hypothetical protein [Alphaproteobacteria bacterium]